MARMDELITEIHESEAMELDGFLDEAQQQRIEDRVLAAIMAEEFEDSERPTESNSVLVPKKQKFSRRKLFVFALAAVFVLGLCVTVMGASNRDWDIEIIQAMGLSNTDTLQLESGEVEIKVSDICNAIEYLDGKETEEKVTITAVNSIGDKNSAFIRVDTDYKVPEGFDPERDYIIAEDFAVRVYEKDPKKSTQTAMGSVVEAMVEDGYLNFMIEISGCKNLNKSYVKLHIQDMYLYPDGFADEACEEELLLAGEWNLQWKYEYKSNTKTYRMLVPLTMAGEKYYISKVEISPISVQIDGFRMPWDRKEEYEDFILNKIYYKDGSELEVDGIDTTGCKNRMWFDTFIGIHQLKEVIDTKNVEAVDISGKKIELK